MKINCVRSVSLYAYIELCVCAFVFRREREGDDLCTRRGGHQEGVGIDTCVHSCVFVSVLNPVFVCA